MFLPNAPHVEIKQGLLAILPDFRGLENENPYMHVKAFEENGPNHLDSTNRNRSSTTTSGGSVFRLREEDNLSAKISLLTKEIEALKLKGSRGVNAIFREEPMESDNMLNPPPLRNNFASSSSSSRPLLEDVLGSKDNQEECKAVIILRSGKELGKGIEKGIPKPNEKSKNTQAEKGESGILKIKEVKKCLIPSPFPQALRLPKNLDVTAKILEYLHQVKVNLSLLHIIKQMRTYAKVPPKYKDLGCSTIYCTIGEYLVERALLDLGVSINLLPFTVYQQMGLGDLKPTSITLQLANRSVRTPRGMVKDVLIKIENFYHSGY
uniref:Aspartic peptidase DDI1-type domain-containing protein n=1 Tax=Fagus sylvatica TaxID=28930 RepID=A0A2N9J080_FAGSY